MKKKQVNKILEDHGSWLLIDISTPTHPVATMAVDKDVFDAHKFGRVFASKDNVQKYIQARFRCLDKMVLFHHTVIERRGGFEIDHIIHGTADHIDNRRCNLRHATRSQNKMNHSIQSNNTSGIVGISWDKFSNQWRSHICVNGKHKTLGRFDNIDIAIGVRQQAEIKYFGEYTFKGE